MIGHQGAHGVVDMHAVRARQGSSTEEAAVPAELAAGRVRSYRAHFMRGRMLDPGCDFHVRPATAG